MAKFNKLTAAQEERLVLLAEEASEIGQAACKALRHGFDCNNPNIRPNFTNNKLDVEKEVGQLMAVVEFMIVRGDLDREHIEYACRMKAERIYDYMHEQGED